MLKPPNRGARRKCIMKTIKGNEILLSLSCFLLDFLRFVQSLPSGMAKEYYRYVFSYVNLLLSTCARA